MADGLANAVALGQERIKNVKELQGQDTFPWFKWVMSQKSQPLNEFGTRIILYLTEDGGETAFTYADSSFRDYIPPEYDAMRVYPARFAKSIVIQGEMLRSLKKGDDNYFQRYDEKITKAGDAARKVLSRWLLGDNTGTMCIATNTVGGTGVTTLNGMFTSGGTSAQASTKGTSWLKKNEVYDAIDPVAETVRGTLTVLSQGRRTCSVNVTAGSFSANDKIVVKGSYKKVPNGIRQLADFNNRVLQNYNTANATQLNTPMYDAGGNALSPAMFSFAKGLIQVYANDVGESKGKMILMTPGHQKTLVNQAFQYRQYVNPKGDETVYGVASKYVDSDGDIHFIDADAPDEQVRILEGNSYSVGESMPWGYYDDDGNQWRMRHGTNTSGSDVWFSAIGWQGQLIKAGRALCDAIIDNVAHSGADYAVQAYA